MRVAPDDGFILPLSVLLVLVLTISGTSFMQQDYLERRLARNEIDNHGAFYLATAGIERARGAFKIPFVNGTPTWTPTLTDATLTDSNPACLLSDPTVCLCPRNDSGALKWGCVIPPFQAQTGGAPVTFPEIPFDAEFDDGEYTVRAFNNPGDPGLGTNDTDQMLTLRALGRVRGEEKLVEVSILAISGLKLINCQEDGHGCPESLGSNSQMSYIDGRKPVQFPASLLPTYKEEFYKDPDNYTFASLTRHDYPGDYAGAVEDNSFYYIKGNATIQGAGGTNVVIFSEQNVTLSSEVTLTNAVIIGQDTVSMDQDVVIRAPRPYPAVIAGKPGDIGGGMLHAIHGAEIHGTIYSAQKTLDLIHTEVHGLLIAKDVRLWDDASRQGSLASDDGEYAYYAFIPGFKYPVELVTTMILPGTWREL